MNIIIHIGWHKTGTTSIQALLWDNGNNLIRENKTYYPTEGLAGRAHHYMAWAIKGQKKSPWGKLDSIDGKLLAKQAIESAKINNCNKIIYSSEEFCTFTEKDILKLKEILNGEYSNIKIVVYLRRQDLLIESSYNSEVKWWGSRLNLSFQEYVKSKTPFHKYDEVIDLWASAFGLENITVRLYDSTDMPKNDVRLDFCNVAGINPNSLVFENRRINSSLGAKGLATLKILNKFYIPIILHKIIVLLFQRFEKPSKSELFEPEQRIAFMESLNNSNRKLKKFSINPDLLILEKDIAKNKKEKVALKRK